MTKAQEVYFERGRALEREDIRRAIAPALRELNRYFRSKKGFKTGDWWHQAIRTIDRATRRARANPKRQPGVLNAQPMTEAAMRKFKAELKATARAKGGSK